MAASIPKGLRPHAAGPSANWLPVSRVVLVVLEVVLVVLGWFGWSRGWSWKFWG